MKKMIIAALTATSAFIAMPAAAQPVAASGTVNVTGSVQPKCTAITPIEGTITLNELAVANGTVDSAFSNNSGGLSKSFTVRCTSANPGLSVTAAPLTTTSTGTPGYTGTVHYTATLTAAKAGGGNATVIDTSNVAAATTGSVTDRLANSNDNVSIAISNGNTTNGADLLEAGSYTGTIAITVSPS
jgi:hypothetical protein